MDVMSEMAAPSDASVSPEDCSLPPGPDELPLVGSTFEIMRRPIEFVDEASAYGDIVTYHVGGQRFTAVLHPEHVEHVLVSEHDRFRRWTGQEWGSAFGGYAEEGLVLTAGDQWRRQRLLIQDAFTPDRIQSYATEMVAETERAVEEWASAERVELKEVTSDLTLRILASTLFDLDIDGRGEVVRRAANTMNDRANTFHLSAFLPNWVPTPANRRLHRAMQPMETVLDDLIEERREDAESRDDLLSLLLTAGDEDEEGLSEQEIRDQLITFLFAGHETSSLALTFGLHAAGRHPSTIRRIRAELDDVTGGDPPGIEDLPALSFTEAVVKESLRLYPPAYALFREALEDVEIGGYRIPEGSKVSLPQINIHRDDRFYDDPETFRPERWTDGLETDLPEYAYFPFGGGPRHCIGMRFAMMELQLAFATLLGGLDITPAVDREPELNTAITLQPAEPLEVEVTPH